MAGGRAATLLEVLTEKFGPLPAELTAAIRGTVDVAKLRAWMSAAIKTPALDEFRKSAVL